MAEGEGFEPPVCLHIQRFSRPPHSTALAPLRQVITAHCTIKRIAPTAKMVISPPQTVAAPEAFVPDQSKFS